MLTIWRRHTSECPHRDKGRDYLKCNCPIWADGYVNGKRTLRQSLKTRDMARARKRAAALEADDTRKVIPVGEAVKAFLDHCRGEGPQPSTIARYRNPLEKLAAFSAEVEIGTLDELTVEELARFRAGRELSPITASKELETMRVFLGFCRDRDWVRENVAQRIKMPRNLKPNEVIPFTPPEIAAPRSLRNDRQIRLRAPAHSGYGADIALHCTPHRGRGHAGKEPNFEGWRSLAALVAHREERSARVPARPRGAARRA